MAAAGLVCAVRDLLDRVAQVNVRGESYTLK